MTVRSKRTPQANQLVRGGEVPWRPLAEPDVTGVAVKTLRVDQASGRASTILLKFEPGASYPAHNHPGGEEIYVLEGDARFGHDLLRAGDYLYTAPDNAHAVHSEGGCILLAVVPEEVEKLKHS